MGTLSSLVKKGVKSIQTVYATFASGYSWSGVNNQIETYYMNVTISSVVPENCLIFRSADRVPYQNNTFIGMRVTGATNLRLYQSQLGAAPQNIRLYIVELY